MIVIEIGNDQPIEAYRTEDGEIRYRPYEGGETATIYQIPDDWSPFECVQAVHNSFDSHFAQGARPTWLECSNPEIREMVLADLDLPKKFPGRPEGYLDPDHPVATEEGPKPKRAARAKKVTKATTEFMAMHLSLVFAFVLVMATRLQLRTTAGRDWQARIMGDTASNATGSYASGTYMGVTADATTPDAAHTTLSGEIGTGTLVRKQCAYSHTVGTSSYTLTAVFVFDQDVTLAKIGIFNAAASGTLCFESLLNAVVVGKPGDQATITETFTL